MIGGYQILDLRGLNLEVTQSEQTLSDPNILEQLLMFRNHIDKAYDFNKPLENQLKPVLIRFRDKKNGEKIEGATFGELSVKGNYYSFQITGRISGAYTLQIVVEFKEITNDYVNQEWVIKTATIQLIDASNVLEGDIAMEGDLSVGGDLSVIGSINGEANPSVKPIYFHPIYMVYDDPNATFRLNWIILDNDPTPLTFTTFKQKLRSIFDVNGDARFITTGVGLTKANNIIAHPIITEDRGSDLTGIYILNSDGTTNYITLENLDQQYIIYFQDGVNKIN